MSKGMSNTRNSRQAAPRIMRGLASSAMGLALIAGGALTASTMPQVGSGTALAQSASAAQAAPDKILLRDGRVVVGTIVEETAEYVSIKILAGGIQSGVATRFNRSDVLQVERAAPAGDPAPTPATSTGGNAARPQPSNTEPTVDPNATRVYRMRLTGEFAKDISQTPILDCLEDAARQQAQIIVVELDNEWQADMFSEKAEDEHAFDEFWRADDMARIFTNDLANLYPRGKPRVVFWVKNAMGGAAFLPFLSPEIYFASNGRMGGIGDLDTYFEGANEWFQDKQQSLRLAEARGIALIGGYDERLIDAMVLREYVLSVGYSTGRPEFYAGPPRPEYNEELLTDDGRDENEDSDADVVRARGNDNLTLHAPLALKIGVSDGTVDSFSELLGALRVDRNHVIVSDRADRIMDDWATGIDQGIRAFVRIRDQELPEARQAESGGEWEQRNAARGRQKALIGQMMNLLNKYAEVLDPQRQLRGQLEVELEAIRLRTIQDRRR